MLLQTTNYIHIALEKCKTKNAILFKLFWYKVLVHYTLKIEITQFPDGFCLRPSNFLSRVDCVPTRSQWGDFHARSRFARSTIPGKMGDYS